MYISESLQISQKEAPTQVFSCEICEIFKNTYFEEHVRTPSSVSESPFQKDDNRENQITEKLEILKKISAKDKLKKKNRASFYNGNSFGMI